jgi:hypothetical protein
MKAAVWRAMLSDRVSTARPLDYVDGVGQFPARTHVNALYWVLLDRWARLRAE